MLCSGDFLQNPHKHTHKPLTTQINSVTPLSWRHTLRLTLPKIVHTLAGLICCRMISHPDCLLLFCLSFACITSSLNFCHSVTRSLKHQLCSSISNQTKTNSLATTFSISLFHTRTHKHMHTHPSSHSISWLLSLSAWIFMKRPFGWISLFIVLPKMSFSLSVRESPNQTHMHSHTWWCFWLFDRVWKSHKTFYHSSFERHISMGYYLNNHFKISSDIFSTFDSVGKIPLTNTIICLF